MDTPARVFRGSRPQTFTRELSSFASVRHTNEIFVGYWCNAVFCRVCGLCSAEIRCGSGIYFDEFTALDRRVGEIGDGKPNHLQLDQSNRFPCVRRKSVVRKSSQRKAISCRGHAGIGRRRFNTGRSHRIRGQARWCRIDCLWSVHAEPYQGNKGADR